jgi:hypothetical protein
MCPHYEDTYEDLIRLCMCVHTTTGPLVVFVVVDATLYLVDLQKGLVTESRVDVYFRFSRKVKVDVF